MHQQAGNLLLCDGSVQQVSSSGLGIQLANSGDATHLPWGPTALCSRSPSRPDPSVFLNQAPARVPFFIPGTLPGRRTRLSPVQAKLGIEKPPCFVEESAMRPMMAVLKKASADGAR
jgi:hypothetical protein